MFTLRSFLMDGFRDAVGKKPDYWIILNASGWADKGVLEMEDLAELSALIEAKNTPQIPDVEEIPVGGEDDDH